MEIQRIFNDADMKSSIDCCIQTFHYATWKFQSLVSKEAQITDPFTENVDFLKLAL